MERVALMDYPDFKTPVDRVKSPKRFADAGFTEEDVVNAIWEVTSATHRMTSKDIFTMLITRYQITVPYWLIKNSVRRLEKEGLLELAGIVEHGSGPTTYFVRVSA